MIDMGAGVVVLKDVILPRSFGFDGSMETIELGQIHVDVAVQVELSLPFLGGIRYS